VVRGNIGCSQLPFRQANFRFNAYSALELLTKEWGIQRIEVPERSAFDWATRLHQKAAYDGFYLAAAEQLGAEFWTADKALANNAGQLGVSWVHWMGEIE
jgi:predicted nucleic acid-binding protein